MSIEKLTKDSQIIIECSGFTQIANHIILHIKDNDAFRAYCFLLSKPGNWEIVKEWTIKACGISERKGRRIWSYFNRCGLLEYHQRKDKSGKITHWDVRILNGSRFNLDVPFLAKDCTDPVDNPISMGLPEANHKADFAPCGRCTSLENAPQVNKDLNKQRNNINNIERARGTKRLRTRQDIDDGFTPNEKHYLLAAQLSIDANKEKERFIDYYKATGKKMIDWNAAFNNWLRKCVDFVKQKANEHHITSMIKDVKQGFQRRQEMMYPLSPFALPSKP